MESGIYSLKIPKNIYDKVKYLSYSKVNVENPITNSENSMIPHAAKNNTKLFCKKVVASIYSSFIRI